MSINSKYYSEDIKNVQKITFNILGNEEVKKYYSVRKDPFGINVADSYDNYEPKKGGLVDLRLGTCDIYLPCTTCGLNSNDCPGHFGHTELAEYVYHFGFLENIVANLKKVCHRCSNLLFDKNDINLQKFLSKSNKMRAKETKELVKNNKFCPHCGTPVPKIKDEVKETTASIKILVEREISENVVDDKGNTTDDKRVIKDELSPRRCYNIFKNVSNNDCILLGFDPDVSRPEDMILTRFPIPPVAIRPTAKIDFMSSSTMEDSLTLKIADIISTNIKVREQMNRESANVKDMNTLLQYHIATYFDNNSKLPTSEFKSGGKPTKSIADRLKAKEGRVRFNLMGKRVDFSARSVITSDPNINIDEVGIPLKVAKELTIPEEVTPKNIKHLTKLVKNGRDVYPGANFVFRTTFINGKPVNQKIDLKYRKKDIKLSYGDIVERHIVNGDYVLFNRQPTLHKPSMMGHKIHVLNRDDANTFRMNVSVAGPYNADFDGDEMNIHLAQSIQARNELERIANVKYQIIGAKNSSPIIGCVQDSISGAFLLSQDKDIDYDLASLLLCTTSSKTKMNLIKNKVITGNELFSYIIPNGINSLKKKGDDIFFQIKNGNLLKGILDKSQLSTSKNSIIHYIWDKYGPQETQDFINDTQRIILTYLMERGLTIGFKDTIISDELNDKVNEYVNSKVLFIKYNITQYENSKEELDLDTIEGSLQNELGAVNANLGKLLMETISHDNNFYTLIGSKAKGKPVNFAQIAGCMGQMTLECKRMKKRINGRTLPIFYQNDDTAGSRGFIASNLVDGLKGHEFFFNAASGREGLIDTAIKSVTGDTPIIIYENGETKRVMIGDWIDNYLDNNKENVEHYEEREMELLKIKEEIMIPTSDLKGNVSWGEITAITRHDPGNELYEIKTSGGRKVIVTESKSLLVWDENIKQFMRKNTPDVVLGDFVPVTSKLCNPPKELDSIDMTKYFSKKEYIYGTEFNIAKDMINKDSHVEDNWWNNSNGKHFTLPYSNSQNFKRCLKRSNIDNIKDGNIYPYSARRNDIKLSEKFELNETNGIFIGLYLAEGNSDIKSGIVQITNSNKDILNFIETWFSNNSITCSYNKKVNSIGGISEGYMGYSTLLAKFLKSLVGNNAKDKYISEELFSANKDFIKGLLNGYFSGDGCVTKNSIQVTSASKDLIEGISMLLNRFNIFSKISKTIMKENNINTQNIADNHTLAIRSNWAKIFQENIKLIDNTKFEKLINMKPSKQHRNFTEFNDVVLDPIIEINKIDVEKYPKVYDLTIPSTLNFGLANGLHVVDTAETGYIQRKLIKELEDLYVRYDGTVRTVDNTVVQYLYGESGINQVKQTEVKLKTIEMNNKQVVDHYVFTKDQLSKLESKFKKKLSNFNDNLKNQMLQFRDDIRTIYKKSKFNYKIIEEMFMLPINLYRLAQEYSNNKESFGIDPEYITTKINDLLEDYNERLLILMNKKSQLLKQDEDGFKYLLRIALYEYIGPKKCLIEYGLTKGEFDNMMNEIKLSFSKAVVEPGEMVGVVAAQSIGEPTSQMTLDTKHFAGVASGGSANMGVSRIKEILGYSKTIKTPQTMVYFDNSIHRDKKKVNIITSLLKHLTIGELISSAEIIYDTNMNDELHKVLENDEVKNPFFINNKKVELDTLPFVIRLRMDIEKLLDKETSLLDIKTKFITYWYKNFSDAKTIKKQYKDLIGNIDSLAILSNNKDMIHIRFRMLDFNYSDLTIFLKTIVLNTVTLKGIDDINGVSMFQDMYVHFDDEGNKKIEKEWVVVTEGINMTDLLTIRNIDHTRTKLNDIMRVYHRYGIEAARQTILNELNLTFSAGGGGDINNAHMSLLVDLMTHLGEIISIARHGLVKIDSEPMAKASFEQTMDHFINAAVYNEEDNINSVSSRIMLGRVIHGGTGCFDIVLDTEKLINSEYIEDETGGRTDFVKLGKDDLFSDIINNELVDLDFMIPN